MAHMGHPGLSAAQKADLWQQWKQGQSLKQDRLDSRSCWALTLAESEEISRGMATGASIRQIAATLGRAPSTVNREIRRHGGAYTYRATEADRQAWQHARRPKPCSASHPPLLQQIVTSKLALDGVVTR